MNELALFAGAGGGILSSKARGHRIVCAVEKDPYCIEVLLRRQEDKVIEAFPIWDDIKTFDGTNWRGVVDFVSAGFPCQPFSQAGKLRGREDDRNLWPETIRIIGEIRPEVVFLENTPGLLRMYGGTVLGDLSEMGYDSKWGIVSAREAGAPHLRSRWWCVAHPNKH